jgi:predicted amidohydrolase YtcJ
MQAIPDAILLLADRVHLLGDRAPVEALLIGGGRVLAAGSEAECRAAAREGAGA